MKGMINLFKNEHNVDSKTPFTKDLTEEFFKTPAEYKNVDLKIHKHAPLPTRHFYQKYADHMRLLMNERNSCDQGIRNGYEDEARHELREYGIDLRDTGLTTQIIRDSLWKKDFAQRAQNYAEGIESIFLNDETLTDRYYKEVAEHIESLGKGEQHWSLEHKDYYDLVNAKIDKAFQNAFLKNLKLMKDRNKDLHKLKKREFFLKMKKFFFENRLLKNKPMHNFITQLRFEELKKQSVYSDFFSRIDQNNSLDETLYHPLNAQKNIELLLNIKDLFEKDLSKTSYRFKKSKDLREKRIFYQSGWRHPMEDAKNYPEYAELHKIRKEFDASQQERVKKYKEQITKEKEHMQSIGETENQKNQHDIINYVVEHEIGKIALIYFLI